MRILQLAPVWETVPPPGYGGTESVVSVLTEELVRRGHEVVLCASGDSMSSADICSVVPRSLRTAGLSEHALQYALIHVAAALRQADDFDVVHNHNGPPSDIAMAMSWLIRTPMLTTLHNLPVPETEFIWRNYTGWYNTISRKQCELVDCLNSARFAGVVHNACDVDTFPFQPEKSDYLLFMGRISPEKAPHLAIEAARRAGGRIVLAGKISMPEERAYFESKVKPLLDGCNVEYVGEADAVLKRELYASARALLMPLLWEEPFGLVLIEAMACGTPCIAFRRGAVPEVIAHGETGFLVDGVDQMATAIDCIERIDPFACREHVAEHFSPAALADKYLALYEKISGVEEYEDAGAVTV